MSKRSRGDSVQFSLDLTVEVTESAGVSSQVAPSKKVLNFVDAGTLLIRREAVRRVRNSGIFSVLHDADAT